MSERNLFLQDIDKNRNKGHINNRYKNLINIDLPDKIISEQSSLNIIVKNKEEILNIDIFSVKRIFSLNQLDYKDYINFTFDKDDLNLKSEEPSLSESLTISTSRSIHKEINDETTDDDGEESIIKEDDKLNKDVNKNDLSLPIKKKNDHIFDPNYPLLNNKICNTFSNLETVPTKYLSLIICGNKAIISIDYLKCMYPSILFCGIYNLIYFISIVFNSNINLDRIYHYFLYIPLSILLIITGLYGYRKVKKNIYDDKFSLILTNLCIISPIFFLTLTRIYQEEYEKSHFILNFIINLISCFCSFSCIIILKEFERVKNSGKDLINI